MKRLHNLYRTGQLKVAHDGVVTVKHTDNAGNVYDAISVPAQFFPGLVHALHIKLSHPSRAQLQRLISRYFYCAGPSRILEEVVSSCTLCVSLKNLPKELFSQSTILNPVFGANFSADVIKKDGQLIFLCREKLSQLTSTRFIPDETADSLRDSVVMAVLELMPDSGTLVQVDCAPGLQTLAAESLMDGSILKKLGIIVDLGRTLNINKNPVAENAIKEFHKERLKVNPAGGRLSKIERSIITKNINSRVRERGLTPKEMAYNRDQISNDIKPSNDADLAVKQLDDRVARHPTEPAKSSEQFSVGQNVFLKSDKSKLRAREMHKVTKLFEKNDELWAIIQKCDLKFMSKEYAVKISEIFPIMKTKNDKGDNIVKSDDQPKEDSEEDENHSKKHKVEDPTVNKRPSKRKAAVKSREKMKEDSEEDENYSKEDKVEEPTENRRPPRRKAALKSREKMKQMVDCLQLNSIKEPIKPPIHGWIYDDWLKEIEDSEDEAEVDITISKFQSWCILQPQYIPVNSIFLHWFKDKYPCIDINAFKFLAESLVDKVTATSLPDTTDHLSVTDILERLENDPPELNNFGENLPTTVGLLQLFPPADEDDNDYFWDNSTTPPDPGNPANLLFNDLMNEGRDLQEEDLQLEKALQPRKLFAAHDDYDIDEGDLTSEDSVSVFDDPSILEVSIDGHRRFTRQGAVRDKEVHLPIEVREAEHDDQVAADNVDDDSARPTLRRRREKIDYKLYHRSGDKGRKK